ncbi:Alpha/Beta hydrolase fold [Phytophthora cactorum]|nr:Alpha/Beta hydrolase fold [Phytophthora cactorum]
MRAEWTRRFLSRSSAVAAAPPSSRRLASSRSAKDPQSSARKRSRSLPHLSVVVGVGGAALALTSSPDSARRLGNIAHTGVSKSVASASAVYAWSKPTDPTRLRHPSQMAGSCTALVNMCSPVMPDSMKKYGLWALGALVQAVNREESSAPHVLHLEAALGPVFATIMLAIPRDNDSVDLHLLAATLVDRLLHVARHNPAAVTRKRTNFGWIKFATGQEPSNSKLSSSLTKDGFDEGQLQLISARCLRTLTTSPQSRRYVCESSSTRAALFELSRQIHEKRQNIGDAVDEDTARSLMSIQRHVSWTFRNICTGFQSGAMALDCLFNAFWTASLLQSRRDLPMSRFFRVVNDLTDLPIIGAEEYEASTEFGWVDILTAWSASTDHQVRENAIASLVFLAEQDQQVSTNLSDEDEEIRNKQEHILQAWLTNMLQQIRLLSGGELLAVKQMEEIAHVSKDLTPGNERILFNPAVVDAGTSALAVLAEHHHAELVQQGVVPLVALLSATIVTSDHVDIAKLLEQTASGKRFLGNIRRSRNCDDPMQRSNYFRVVQNLRAYDEVVATGRLVKDVYCEGVHPIVSKVTLSQGSNLQTMTHWLMWCSCTGYADILSRNNVPARLVTLGYEAGMVSWSSPWPSLTLQERARVMLSALYAANIGRDRRHPGAPARPVVFITHSMGGLLTKKMLLLEREQRDQSGLADSTTGVVFLAVPHFGSDLVKGVRSESIRKLIQAHPAIEDLAVDPNGRLKGLNHNFKQLGIDCFSVGEERAAPVALGLSAVVVKPDSADPGFGRFYVLAESDHMTICKAKSRDEPLYQDILQYFFFVYEAENRPLWRLAQTGRLVQQVESFHRTLDAITSRCGLAVVTPGGAGPSLPRWQARWRRMRAERLVFFRSYLEDHTAAAASNSRIREPADQLELLTLFKHDARKFDTVLTADELELLERTFAFVAGCCNNIMNFEPQLRMMPLPEWFVAPYERTKQQLKWQRAAVTMKSALESSAIFGSKRAQEEEQDPLLEDDESEAGYDDVDVVHETQSRLCEGTTTRYWQAPELVNKAVLSPTEASDVFALGIDGNRTSTNGLPPRPAALENDWQWALVKPSLILRFRSFLQRHVNENPLLRLATTRQIIEMNVEFHGELDVLMDRLRFTRSGASIHSWGSQQAVYCAQLWKRMRLSLAMDAQTLNGELDGEQELSLLGALLAFEAKKRSTSYAAQDLEMLQTALVNVEEIYQHMMPSFRTMESRSMLALPPWFVPPYEVLFNELDAFSRGAFGSIHFGKWMNVDVVVKKMLSPEEPGVVIPLRSQRGANLNPKEPAEDQYKRFLTEMSVWSTLKHPNVLKLLGASHVGQHQFFVCEYATQGTIDSFVASKSDKDRGACARRMLHDAALGLHYLHTQNIVHADLRCNNILVDAQGVVKLTDFGFSSLKRSNGFIGELAGIRYRWVAPECLSGERPTFASNVYSFAMCAIEVVSGELPWGGDMTNAVVCSKVRKGLVPPRPATCFSDSEWTLIERMCCYHPKQRITISEVVRLLT